MKLRCRFGEPEYGWLPVELLLDEQLLELDVSDVPLNPIDSLIDCLGRAISGLEAEALLHLEPSCYYLSFRPLAKNRFGFRLEFSERDTRQQQSRTLVYETDGNSDEVILPFWRALKEFSSHSYKDPAWPEVDKLKLSKLTELLKAK